MASRSAAYARRADILCVRGRLHPGERTVSLRRQGPSRSRSCRPAARRRRRDDQRRRPVRCLSTRGSASAGVGDPELAERKVSAIETASIASRTAVIRSGSPARPPSDQPVQMPPDREGAALGHLERLEHAVSDHQAVVGAGDDGLVRIVVKAAVQPDPELPGQCLRSRCRELHHGQVIGRR